MSWRGSSGKKPSKGARPKTRLPITAEVLRRMKQVWLSAPENADKVMLWAAACTGFFGFLRAGEFTVPSKQAYEPEVHLNLADLAIDSHDPNPLNHKAEQDRPFSGGC